MLYTAVTRRTLLGAATAGLVVGTAATARAAAAPGSVTARLRHLEHEHGAEIGAIAYNTATGATVAHRAHELFPICSVFKAVLGAAVLRDLDRNGETLRHRIRYTEADLVPNSPVTEKNLATGMTIAELCHATITVSDNTAANLLLRELGGPTAITRFCRSIGDPVTRVDRYETDMSSSEPWRVTDTTSPFAIAYTFRRLVLGTALVPKDRAQLTDWLLDNKTSAERFHAGLPDDWTIADKTGTGLAYGVAHDVGIVWPPDGTPIVLAVLTRKPEAEAAADNPLIAKTTAVLAEAISPSR